MEMDGPVTLLIRHRIKPGKESEFEEWLRSIVREASAFEGYLGYNVVRPIDPRHPEYIVFFRFDSYARLEKWEESEVRRHWLTHLESITLHPSLRERHTGLEVWFTPVPGQASPPRWKLAAVTALTIYPLILLVHFLLGPFLVELHVFVRSLISAVLLVCVMTYFAMPMMTRLFSGWLYHRPIEPKDSARVTERVV